MKLPSIFSKVKLLPLFGIFIFLVGSNNIYSQNSKEQYLKVWGKLEINTGVSMVNRVNPYLDGLIISFKCDGMSKIEYSEKEYLKEVLSNKKFYFENIPTEKKCYLTIRFKKLGESGYAERYASYTFHHPNSSKHWKLKEAGYLGKFILNYPDGPIDYENKYFD